MPKTRCEQCNCEMNKSLSATITSQQLKVAKDPENSRLICVGCFCQNGMKFECPEELRQAPLPKELVKQRNEEKEERRKQKRIERKKAKPNTHTSKVPNGEPRYVARWDLSKKGRLGRPKSARDGDDMPTYACPICSVAVKRVHNLPGRTLDDVVEHMLIDGCYDKFLAEEQR